MRECRHFRVAARRLGIRMLVADTDPQVLSDEMKQSADYAVGEKHVSEIVEEFMKKYYPDEKKG